MHVRGTDNSTGTLKISTLVDGIPRARHGEWKPRRLCTHCHRRSLNWLRRKQCRETLGRAWHKDQGRSMLVTVLRGHVAVRAGQVVYSRSSSCDAERSPPCEDEETRMKAFVSVAPKRIAQFQSSAWWRASGARSLQNISTLVISGETCNSAVWKQGARCFSEVVPSLWWCLHTQAGTRREHNVHIQRMHN